MGPGQVVEIGVAMVSSGREASSESGLPRSPDDGFADMMVRIRAGDDAAETAVFRRFVHRLIALAASRFETWLRERADVEVVVLSAYKSFFLRNNRGEFDLAGWDELWALLTVITLRKCRKRRKYLLADIRDVSREVPPSGANGTPSWLPDHAPTPAEAATLAETVEQLFRAMSVEDRPIVEQILIGYTAGEIGERLDCSARTVRRVRQRAKHRLQRLIEADNTHAETT